MIGALIAIQIAGALPAPLPIPPLPEQSAPPDIHTTADLLQVCGQSLQGACWTYMEGVLQGVQMMREAGGAKDELFCPGKATTYDAIRAVVAYAELHPALASTAAATVSLAMRERFPCVR